MIVKVSVVGTVTFFPLFSTDAHLFQPEDSNGQLDYRYDEFGFKVEEEGKISCI